jgi:hypothetical protein
MCPLCIGAAALLVSGGTSAGGLTALLLRQRAARKSRKRTAPIDGRRGSATAYGRAAATGAGGPNRGS